MSVAIFKFSGIFSGFYYFCEKYLGKCIMTFFNIKLPVYFSKPFLFILQFVCINI